MKSSIIIKKIDKRREFLSELNTEFLFTDYGVGSRDEKRSVEQMNEGVKSIKTLKDFSHIGLKGQNAKFLFDIIEKISPNIVLELGCCLGFSSILFKNASQKSKIYTLEGDENLAKFAKDNFSFFGIEDIEIIIGKFNDTLLNLLLNLPKINFVFIDGHHDFDATISYFQTILPFMDKKGVMAFDDINYNEKMALAWDKIKKQSKYTDDGKVGVLWL